MLSPWNFQRKHTEYAYKVAVALDPTFPKNASSKDLLAFLRNSSAEDIYDTLTFGVWQLPLQVMRLTSFLLQNDPESEELTQGDIFGAAIEPKYPGAFLTQLQYEAIQNGNLIRVPYLIGTTSEEMLQFRGTSKYTTAH